MLHWHTPLVNLISSVRGSRLCTITRRFKQRNTFSLRCWSLTTSLTALGAAMYKCATLQDQKAPRWSCASPAGYTPSTFHCESHSSTHTRLNWHRSIRVAPAMPMLGSPQNAHIAIPPALRDSAAAQVRKWLACENAHCRGEIGTMVYDSGKRAGWNNTRLLHGHRE